MRFKCPDFVDSSDEEDEDDEEEEEEEETPAPPAAPAANNNTNAANVARIVRRRAFLVRVTKKKKDKRKKLDPNAAKGKTLRFEAYYDAYNAKCRERRIQRFRERIEREQQERADMFGNPLACGLEYLFEDFVKRLASGAKGVEGPIRASACVAPGAFPGLPMVESDNEG